MGLPDERVLATGAKAYAVENFASLPQELQEYAAPIQKIFSVLQEKCSWSPGIYR